MITVGVVAVGSGLLARRQFGRRWGLPPGALHVLPIAAFEDPNHLARQAERLGPVFKIANTLPTPRLRPTVCVVGLSLGRDLLRDHDVDLAAPALPTSQAVPSGFLRNMERADHERYSPLFRAAAAAMLLPDIESAGPELARLIAALRTGEPAGVHPGAAIRTAVRGILIPGVVGVSDRADVDFVNSSIDDIEAGARRWKPVEPRRRSFQRTIDHLGARVDDLLPTSLLAGALARRPADLKSDVVIGNAVQIVALSTTDVSALMVWVIDTLARQPAQAERVRADIATGDEQATTAFLREVLRLNQSEYVHRVAQKTFWFHGHRIPAGWTVRICVRESHRLASSFDQPDLFDPDRFAAALPDRSLYSPFGLFRHHCIGGGLTLAIGGLVLRALLSEHTVDLVRDASPEHNPNHWEPGRRLRVRLVPAGAVDSSLVEVAQRAAPQGV